MTVGNPTHCACTFDDDDEPVRRCMVHREMADRIAQLEAALRMYGAHLPQCETLNNSFGLPCNCGFDAALAPKEPK